MRVSPLQLPASFPSQSVRRRQVVAILIALLAIAAACGDGDGDGDGNASASASLAAPAQAENDDEDAPAGSAPADETDETDAGGAETDDTAADDAEPSSNYPVTIEHTFGSTTVDARPERIVTLNVQWTDAVVALGEVPVGYVLTASAGETDLYPWQAGRLDGAERIDATGGVPFEAIAALQPDLILFTFAVADSTAYETLNAIAPAIGGVSDLQVDPWPDQVRALGRILGDPATADDLIAAVDGEIADLALALPGLAGTTYTFANYVPGDSIYVIADPDDGASELFNALGMELDPDIVALDTSVVGRVQISLEEVGLLQADLVGVLLNGTDPADVVGLDALPSSQSGALIDFAFADVVGLNTPSPLSVPYLLELLRPSLEIVAG
ncbi:MAG: ABC transporter substrate-binding protein [Actinomycetota bacterium]